MSNLSSQDALNSIRKRQGYMVAAQIATVAAIQNQTSQVTSAINLVDDTLRDVQISLETGLDSIEQAISQLETNILESLSDIKWYLHNVDDKLAEVINLIKFSSATKSDEYNEQGFVLFRMEDYSKAKEQFLKSIDENPLNVHAHVNLAFTEIKLGDDQSAVSTFERALKILEADYSYSKEITPEQVNRTKSFVKLSLGEILLRLQKPLESKVHFSYVVNNSTDNIEVATAMYNSARCSYELGVFSEVEETIKKMITNRTISLVAIAVGGDHFMDIRERILEIIEEEVQSIKKSFGLLFEENSNNGEDELHNKVQLLTNKIIHETDYRKVLSPMLFSDYSYLINIYSWYNRAHSFFKVQRINIENRLNELKKALEFVNNSELPDIEKEYHNYVRIMVQNKYAKNVDNYVQEELKRSKKEINEIKTINNRLGQILKQIEPSCKDFKSLELIRGFELPKGLTSNLAEKNLQKINQLTENYL